MSLKARLELRLWAAESRAARDHPVAAVACGAWQKWDHLCEALSLVAGAVVHWREQQGRPLKSHLLAERDATAQ